MGAELPGPTHFTVGVPVTPLATLTLHVRVYGCPSVGFPPAVTETSTVNKHNSHQQSVNEPYLPKSKYVTKMQEV